MNLYDVLQILAFIGAVTSLFFDVSIKTGLLKELNYTGLFPFITEKWYEQPAEITSTISANYCEDRIKISTGEVYVLISPEKLITELKEANSRTIFEVTPFGFTLESQLVNVSCKMINTFEKIEVTAQNAYGKISKVIENGSEIYNCEGKCNNWKLTNSTEFCENLLKQKKEEIEKAIELSNCFK